MNKRIVSSLAFLSVMIVPAIAGNDPVPSPGLTDEAGFISLEPVSISFQYGGYFSRLALRSSEARMWYSFHAADENPAAKPLFVFFNGGPGSASSSGLLSMSTAPYTLDNRIAGGGDAFVPNPFTWTALGNLLHVDSRESGFSYNLRSGVGDEAIRLQEFNAQNFNPFFDAADIIRVVLRFLAAHPALQRNPVVIVGESYGGIRATAMLHILLNYADYGNGREMYQDQALVDEIRAHYRTVFPEAGNAAVPPEIISRQFGCQVLIQPALSFDDQEEITDDLLGRPGSLVYKLGEEIGIPYDPRIHGDPRTFVESVAGRDLYIYTKPRGWLSGFFSNAGRLLRWISNLRLATGMDVAAIPGLYAAARTNAYRVIRANDPDVLLPGWPSLSEKRLFFDPVALDDPEARDEPGDLPFVFGALRPWDRYFLSSNGNALWAFHVFNIAKIRGYEVHFGLPRYGKMFLKNLAHVRTFITDAALDLVVYSEALPPALARHQDIVRSVEHRSSEPLGEARPGTIVLKFQAGAFADVSGLEERTIRFPIYASSCHAVSLTQPAELLADVRTWLGENGILRESRVRR